MSNRKSWALLAHPKIKEAGYAVLAASPDINAIIERGGEQQLFIFKPTAGPFVLTMGQLTEDEDDIGETMYSLDDETIVELGASQTTYWLDHNNTWSENS